VSTPRLWPNRQKWSVQSATLGVRRSSREHRGVGRDARDRAKLGRGAGAPVSAAVGLTLSSPMRKFGAIGSGRPP
jgi:hypothetical protein